MEGIKKSTEFSILYLSGDNREIYLRDLLTGNNVMDPEEYIPENFWGRTGGLEIVIGEYMVIFRSLDFHYLCRIVMFLLHALYKIRGITSSWFDEEYPDSIIVLTTGGKSLTVKLLSENVSLSFLTKGNTADNKVRGDRFFADIIFEQDVFFNATKTALSEYFAVVQEIIRDNPENTTASVMKEFLEVWQGI